MIQKYRAYSEQYGMREVIGLYWFDEYIKVTLKNGISSPIRACTMTLNQIARCQKLTSLSEASRADNRRTERHSSV